MSDFRRSLKSAVRVGVSTFDYHGLHLLGLRMPASVARAQILLPLRVVLNGVWQQGSGLRACALVTQANEFRHPIIVRGGEIARIDGDGGVGQSQRVALILQDHHAHGAGKDAGQGFQLFMSAKWELKIDGDDGVGIHLARHLHRNVLDHAAIGQHMTIDFHWSENTRNRHAGAHGPRQRTITEYHAISALHIGGHAAKRDGQVIEAGDAGLGEGDAIEQHADAEARIETVGTPQPMLYAERGLDLVIAAILLTAIRKLTVRQAREAALHSSQCLQQISAFPSATCRWRT